MELPAMDPCPADPKRGAHHLGAIIPENDGGDLTLFCEACGSIRRVPVTGAIVPAAAPYGREPAWIGQDPDDPFKRSY